MDNNKFPGHASGREFQNPVQAKAAAVPEVPKGVEAALENSLPEPLAQGTQERLISWFGAPVSNTVPGGVLSLQEVYQRIKSPMYAAVTNQLRGIGDKKQRREFKAKHFDYVTFGGVFSSRRNSALLQPSYLAVFDFDELGEALPRMRELLKHDQVLPTELLFTSPSGNGLKWVVRYEPQVCGYLEFFQGVSHYLHKSYGLTPDASGKDIARACFLCHDPEIFMRSTKNQQSADQQSATNNQQSAYSPATANSLQPKATHNQQQPKANSLQPTATLTNNNKS